MGQPGAGGTACATRDATTSKSTEERKESLMIIDYTKTTQGKDIAWSSFCFDLALYLTATDFRCQSTAAIVLRKTARTKGSLQASTTVLRAPSERPSPKSHHQ